MRGVLVIAVMQHNTYARNDGSCHNALPMMQALYHHAGGVGAADGMIFFLAPTWLHETTRTLIVLPTVETTKHVAPAYGGKYWRTRSRNT